MEVSIFMLFHLTLSLSLGSWMPGVGLLFTERNQTLSQVPQHTGDLATV